MAKEGKLVKKTRGPIPTTKPQADKGTQNPYYDAIDKRFSRAECLAMAERLKENPRFKKKNKSFLLDKSESKSDPAMPSKSPKELNISTEGIGIHIKEEEEEEILLPKTQGFIGKSLRSATVFEAERGY
ncbi:hypothetical protein V6N13_135198 [Hibiscus sabdariffa]